MMTQQGSEKEKNPDLRNMVDFFGALQLMFERTSKDYVEKSVDSKDSLGPTSAAKLLKVAMPIVLTMISKGIAQFNEYLENPKSDDINKKPPTEIVSILGAAKRALFSEDGLTETLANTLTQAKIDGTLTEETIKTLFQVTFSETGFSGIFAQFGIDNIGTVGKTIGASIKSPYIKSMVEAIHDIEIRDKKTAQNMKELVTTLEKQIELMFDDKKNAKEIDQLISPIAVSTARTLGFNKVLVSLAKSVTSSSWLTLKLISKFVYPILGLSGNEFDAPTSYSDFLKKILLHVVGELKQQIKNQEDRLEFEEKLDTADAALRELRKRLSECVTEVSQSDNPVKKVKAFSGLAKRTSEKIVKILTSQKPILEKAAKRLQDIQDKISEIQQAPLPWTAKQFKELTDLIEQRDLEPKERIPPEYLPNIAIEPINIIQKLLSEMKIKEDQKGRITSVLNFGASFVTTYEETAQDKEFKRALSYLTDTVQEKLKENKKLLTENQNNIISLEDLHTQASKLEKLADKKSQLLSLGEINEKIESIQKSLKSYRHSFQHFFGWLAHTFGFKSTLAKKYEKYHTLTKRLNDFLEAQTEFAKNVREKSADVSKKIEEKNTEKGINIEKEFENEQDEKERLKKMAEEMEQYAEDEADGQFVKLGKK